MLQSLLVLLVSVLLLGVAFASDGKHERVPTYEILELEENAIEVNDKKFELCERIDNLLGENAKYFDGHYIMDVRELEQIMDFNENAFKIFLHPVNFDVFYKRYKKGKQDLKTHIKHQLYPGDNSELIFEGLKVSKNWHKAMFLDLNLNGICDILAEDRDSINPGFGVFKVIQERQNIREKLDGRIFGWLSPITPSNGRILLEPEYEDFFIGSYQGGKLTLENHIKLQLYPRGLSFLKGTGATILEEKQEDILKLLTLDEILTVANNQKNLLDYYGIKGFFQQKNIITELYNAIIRNHWQELSLILVGIPMLEEMSKFKPYGILKYKELYKFVSEDIIPVGIVRVELIEAINNWKNNHWDGLHKFFPLENVGDIVVDQRTQQQVFELLFQDKYLLAGFLASLGYLWRKNLGIENFIKQEAIIVKLRDLVVMSYLEEIRSTLADVSGLEALKWWRFSPRNIIKFTKTPYQQLCNWLSTEIVPRSIIYKELEEEVEGWENLSKFYSLNLFFLEELGITIDLEKQERIANLILGSPYELTNTLLGLGYHKQNDCKIREFINQKENLTKIRDRIIVHHWIALGKILTEIPELIILKCFAPYILEQFGRNEYPYQVLVSFLTTKIIRQSKIYEELEKATDKWTNMSSMCPDNFLYFEKTDIIVDLEMQQKLFVRLFTKVYMLADILVKIGYHNQKEINIKDFIKQEENLIQIRDILVSSYWEDLLDILVTIPRLRWLVRWRHWNVPKKNAYQELCCLIHKEVNVRNILYKQLENITMGWSNISKLCPNNFFSLEEVNVKVDLEIQQKIFELLFASKEKAIDFLIFFGYFQQEGLNIHEFINQKAILARLRNMVVVDYWSKILVILSKVSGLELLERFCDIKIICPIQNAYQVLCDLFCSLIIPNNIIYLELKSATNNWSDIATLCPANFFDLGEIDLVPPEIQQKIFTLLFVDEFKLTQSLTKWGYRAQEKGSTIKNFISNSEIINKLREMIVCVYGTNLVDILTEIPVLKKLPKDKAWSGYKELCEFVSKEVIPGEILDNIEGLFERIDLN